MLVPLYLGERVCDGEGGARLHKGGGEGTRRDGWNPNDQEAPREQSCPDLL